jgi:cyanate permease
MQRVWTVVLSVWAMLAVVVVLAWSHRLAPAVSPQPTTHTLVVKTVHGKQRLVILKGAAAGPTHATTATSKVVR